MADWGARLRAAWRGEVSDADVGALFTATAGLDGLHQSLEDRRLTAQIDNAGHDWRAVLAVGKIAAPLWLADALVALAGAFYDTETQSHPGRPASVSAYTHDLVATLLAPVEDIIADVTAALADPDHRTALSAPLQVGPSGDIAAYPQPEPVPSLYARGLSTAARRVHTSAAVTLAAAQQAVAKSPSPDWLVAGLRRLDGELQAAGARLDIAEVRLTPLLDVRSSDHAALASVCRDLWAIADTAMVAGQVASDPHLLPEARAARPLDAASSPPLPQAPAPPPRTARARPFALPQIAEGSPSKRDAAQAPGGPTAGTSPEVPLPAIGEGAPAAPPARPLPSAGPAASAALPGIGAPDQPPEAPPRRPTGPPADAAETKASEAEDEPPVAFPAIG